MRDVIPTGASADSEFLFERMTHRTLAAVGPEPGRRVLDVAAGVGQDAAALAEAGMFSVAAEPSSRMSELAKWSLSQRSGPHPVWVRGWSDRLPFATGSFDAVFCKGALDHFDHPTAAIAEMARVTRTSGVVVLAIANFDSLSCRVSRLVDRFRETGMRRPVPLGRRGHDVPHDHFTRYEVGLMREQASVSLDLHCVEGVSMAWGMPHWAHVLESMPRRGVQATLEGLDWLARRVPALADVVVLAGRPLRSSNTAA
ncbi:methyltransferase domain-containing protein [Myxococcota bacterium]|nr:methyltransferase domain-containing protein [Myxococcota bacterium]